MSACGTQTAAERSPGSTGAAATATAVAPSAPTATAVPPVTTIVAPPATAPTPGGDDPGATATTPGQDGGAPDPGPAPATGAADPPGGDEAGNRVPVSFTVSAGAATPATITVPPFLGILLRGTSGDGKAHAITVRTPTLADPLTVPASGTVSRSLEGLPAGSYPVQVDGQVVATVRVADDAAGP